MYLFVNGVSYTLTVGTAPGDLGNIAATFNIGSNGAGTGFFNGYIDAVRITKGTALWTSNFTPPTTIDDYVSTSAITIFGLEGDTDEQYMLDCNFVNASGSTCDYQVRLNGDSGSNYGFQRLIGNDSTIGASRSAPTGLNLAYSTTGNICFGGFIIHAKSGYVRTIIGHREVTINGTTVTEVGAWGQSWNNTADEVTSITIFGSVADAISTGSTISLYRRISS